MALLSLVDPSSSSSSSEKYLGRFEISTHGVQGDLYQLPSRGRGGSRLRVHRMYYDGEGPGGVRLAALPVGAGDTKADYPKVRLRRDCVML